MGSRTFAWLVGAAFAASCVASTNDWRASLPGEARSERRWEYEVRVGESGRELDVVGRFWPESGGRLTVHARATDAVSGVRLADGTELARDGADWVVPEGLPKPLEVRWRVDLGRVTLDDGRFHRREPAWSVEPKTFLVRPVGGWERTWVRVDVDAPDGVPVASGIARDETSDAWVFPAHRLGRLPYTLIGGFRERELDVAGTSVEVAILPGSFRVTEDDLLEYVERCVTAVADFYGRFPLEHALVVVQPSRRGGYGRAMGSGGGSVLYLLDRRAGRRELMDDWVLVHELLHFACPLLPAEHHWFEEGLSTWLEPLVRFRAGWITAEEVWRELHEDMRNGLPRPGDQGLDRTRTWGNTYWGGALFCMLADVEIRERSGGELALGDALRAIVEAGGSIAVGGTMRETLATGDAALGFDVLVPLWERVRHTPLDIDLDELWERLGVSRARRPGPDEVGLDDDAPLARVRRAIAGDLTVRFPARP